MRAWSTAAAIALATSALPPVQGAPLGAAAWPQAPAGDSYLSWTAKQAEQIGLGMRQNGRVGGIFDFRVVHTERSYNYKLRATWLTPEVIRATARLVQLRERLTDDQTRALVAEAQQAGDTVFLVEIDPREGSGVIPNEWLAVLQPRREERSELEGVKGESVPKLRNVRALAGVAARDYSYDLFWVVFPLRTARDPLFSPSVNEAELVVRIHSKEGRVRFLIPASIRQRFEATRQHARV